MDKKKKMMKKTYFFAGVLVLLTAGAVIGMQGCGNGSGGNAVTGEPGKMATGEFVFKERLSEYGFFSDKLSDLHPVKGVMSYELATPLFTDYALKDRFIVLPVGRSVRYTRSGVLDFPDSTIIIKNFAYRNTEHRKVMIETRLLVKDPAGGKWRVMDYLWDSTQTDAVRHITGAKVPVTLLDDEGNAISTVYQVPNTNDCKRCHVNDDVLTPIGPKARNLNFVRSGQTVNQLIQWAAQGSLSGLPVLDSVDRLPDWRDSVHYSVAQRARAYLDVNCAH